MNDSNDEHTDPVPEEQPATSETPDSREAFRDLGDAVKNAFRAGASDAKKAAKDAVPRAGEEFSKGFHDLAYGFAYLASFGAAIAREVTPDPVSDGFSEGTEAGRQAAEKMMEKRRKAAEESEASPGEEDSVGPDFVPVA